MYDAIRCFSDCSYTVNNSGFIRILNSVSIIIHEEAQYNLSIYIYIWYRCNCACMHAELCMTVSIRPDSATSSILMRAGGYYSL